MFRKTEMCSVLPVWSNLLLRFDVALLRLTTDAKLDSYVKLGSLPPANQILPNNNLCYITGWGRTSSELNGTSGSTSLSELCWSIFIKLNCLPFLISPFSSWRSPVPTAQAGLPSCGRPSELLQAWLVGQHRQDNHGVCRWSCWVWMQRKSPPM